MTSYDFDYELPRKARRFIERRKRRRQERRAKGFIFRDGNDSGAYYYDLATRHPAGARVKRAFDVIGSTALITLLVPLLLLIMILIKATSRGPAVFKQRRIGFRANEFEIYKFRTMYDGSDKAVTPMDSAGTPFVKPKNDARVTAVGRYLRKYSLDELPQLFNVLEGSMSLVGPRPLRECDLARLPRRIMVRRFATPPGITGLWQVSGRSNLVGTRALQLDREYVDRWSLGLDLQILLRTFRAVIAGRDAV
ncbi:MAG TPA: sugar transferase [Thermoanaerobaculia bacterium]|nr:sugar transferase [Thermoanaerobaculia bacterium]